MEVSFPLIAFPQILHMKMCLGIHACVCIFGSIYYVHVYMCMLLSLQNPLLWHENAPITNLYPLPSLTMFWTIQLVSDKVGKSSKYVWIANGTLYKRLEMQTRELSPSGTLQQKCRQAAKSPGDSTWWGRTNPSPGRHFIEYRGRWASLHWAQAEGVCCVKTWGKVQIHGCVQTVRYGEHTCIPILPVACPTWGGGRWAD